MEAAVVLIFVALAAVVYLVVHLANQATLRRRAAFRGQAEGRGWHYVERDDAYAYRWRGQPFRGRRGHARNVVSGQHAGRDFVAFEFAYATRSSPHTDTAIGHRFAVWTVALPTLVPSLSVSRQGARGKVAKAFDATRFDIGDDEFDASFDVHGEDERFAIRVLQPLLVEYLKSTGPWDWRFEGDTMIAYDRGPLELDQVEPKIELMAGVLDRVPVEAWQQPRHNPAEGTS
jgi:hypothetical protein